MAEPRGRVKNFGIDECYKVFRIDSSASMDEIKKRYRILAKKCHPDRNKDEKSAMRFKALNQAYALLKQYHEARGKLEKIRTLEEAIEWDSEESIIPEEQENHFVQIPYDTSKCCGAELKFNDKFYGDYFKIDVAECNTCFQRYYRKPGGTVMYIGDDECFAYCGNCGEPLDVMQKEVYTKVFGVIKTKKKVKTENVYFCRNCEGVPVFDD